MMRVTMGPHDSAPVEGDPFDEGVLRQIAQDYVKSGGRSPGDWVRYLVGMSTLNPRQYERLNRALVLGAAKAHDLLWDEVDAARHGRAGRGEEGMKYAEPVMDMSPDVKEAIERLEGPPDPVRELIERADSKRAADPELSPHTAMAMVLAEDADLVRRYRRATTRGADRDI